MARPVKSQWEFGELFPAETGRKVLSVTEITVSIKRLLEKELGQVWVTGEMTNVRHQSSGHSYFSIKDGNAQLSCVLFRGEARSMRRELMQDGLKVVLGGELTVDEARGQYQLRVTEVELQGVGALQAAFEKLKQKLNAEGLFAADRKREIPLFPRGLGIVTSATGAALQDVLRVIQRRAPSLGVVLAGCRVQGVGAAEEIAEGIRQVNEWAAGHPEQPLDVILVTRGGGSLEDLWAFNEEVVARAVAGSRVPVVSGVGHEIDFTICDFAADFRASTPTAAAEILTEGLFRAAGRCGELADALSQAVRDGVEGHASALEQLRARLQRVHPRRRLEERAQQLDDSIAGLGRGARLALRQHREHSRELVERLLRLRPAQTLEKLREHLLRLQEAMAQAARLQSGEAKARLLTASERLRLLSPANVLERGYSITFDAESGAVLRKAGDAAAGSKLRTRLASGEVESVVTGGITSGGKPSPARKPRKKVLAKKLEKKDSGEEAESNPTG